jgi:alkylation response protein AidB-like acyl-CoA dehydrogenase
MKMSVLYDEGQQQIAAEAARLLAARYSGERLKATLETCGAYDEDFWRICRDQGWTAITIPEAFGGLGLGLLELGLIAEACGAVTCGAPFLGTSFAAGQAILRYGDSATQQIWLPALARGEAIGAVGFAEGQDVLPVAPTVHYANGRLSGTKPAVPAGAVAQIAVVLASSNQGPALAVVALDAAEVTRTTLATFDNSRCAADLAFDDAKAMLLGGAADALAAARAILRLQAVITAHEQVGGAQKMMTTARDYALQRRAFGQPIGAFQSVKHRIAEDYVLVELARANAIHAAASADDADFGRYAAAARLSATEAYDTASRDAVQVHGGIGVTWEADLHLHQRRARTLAIEQGSMMFWEDELVNDLERAAR